MNEAGFCDTDALSGAAVILTVSALNRLVRTALESNFPLLRISGEISNLTRAASGHMYFTLKDATAQVRCVMWRNRAQLLPFRAENGMRVEARALVTFYEPRGDFQLTVESFSRDGTGNLYEAFLRLKEKLSHEGLFDPARKKALPRFPRRIGIITSPTAAALQDVLSALRRRAPHLEIVLYPSQVQGQTAAEKLTEMVRTASQRAAEDAVDVLLLVRGGGSLEDLWAFNDETLARAICHSMVPVISGIGHETDFTIADFAADIRAATPTAAAELISAGYQEAAAKLDRLTHILSKAWSMKINMLAQRLDRAALGLMHPQDRLNRSRENLSYLRHRLDTATYRHVELQAGRLHTAQLRLAAVRPDLSGAGERCARASVELRQTMRRRMQTLGDRLTTLLNYLDHLAPQSILARGYSITRTARGDILRHADMARIGEKLSIQLSSGYIEATVDAQMSSTEKHSS